MRIVYHVFKLSDLQYGHNAMSPCVSFLIFVQLVTVTVTTVVTVTVTTVVNV